MEIAAFGALCSRTGGLEALAEEGSAFLSGKMAVNFILLFHNRGKTCSIIRCKS